MQERELLATKKPETQIMGSWFEAEYPKYKEDPVITAPPPKFERLWYIIFGIVVVGSPFIYDQLVEKFFSK